MLKNDEAASRAQAIVSLTTIGANDKATVGAITDALQDSDAKVREAATSALAKLQAK